MRTVSVVAALAACLVTARPAPAEACSHPHGSGIPVLVLPVAGATDAPTNAVVVVAWPSWPMEDPSPDLLAARLTLRSTEGAVVPAAVELGEPWGRSYGLTMTMRLTPAALLPASTTFEVHAHMPSNFTEPDLLVGRFTTGTAEDHEAPAAPQLVPVIGEVHACDYGDFGCCAAGKAIRTGVLEGGQPGLAYRLTSADDLIQEGAPAPLDGLVVCGGSYPDFDMPQRTTMPWFLLEGSFEITAVAYDAAGNASPPATFTLDVPCPPSVDAGVPAEGDLPTMQCGCRVGGAEGRGAVPAGALVSVLVLAAACAAPSPHGGAGRVAHTYPLLVGRRETWPQPPN